MSETDAVREVEALEALGLTELQRTRVFDAVNEARQQLPALSAAELLRQVRAGMACLPPGQTVRLANLEGPDCPELVIDPGPAEE
jgi:hypothetical protein